MGSHICIMTVFKDFMKTFLWLRIFSVPEDCFNQKDYYYYYLELAYFRLSGIRLWRRFFPSILVSLQKPTDTNTAENSGHFQFNTNGVVAFPSARLQISLIRQQEEEKQNLQQQHCAGFILGGEKLLKILKRLAGNIIYQPNFFCFVCQRMYLIKDLRADLPRCFFCHWLYNVCVFLGHLCITVTHEHVKEMELLMYV